MPPQKITPAVMHREYADAIAGFAKCIPQPALRQRFALEVDPFFRQCALGLWKHSGPVTEAYPAAYNTIYSRGAEPPHAMYWETVSAVADAPAFSPPGFFRAMVEDDRAMGHRTAQRFIDIFSMLLLLFAAVDDDVTQAEADYVRACQDALWRMVEADGSPTLNPSDFITAVPPSQTAVPVEKAAPAAQNAPSPPPEIERPDPDALLAELDSLCGLEQIKADVRSLVNLIKVRKLREEHQLPVPPMSLHLVFLGNPGTGKTTVARLLAKIYHAIGVLDKGQLIEVDRNGLVAGFVGQTAIKTQEVITSALGGVLFIDEAYSLTNQEGGSDFGKEAIEVLLKNMEDHRADLVVIVAGYEDLMEDFIHSNPGLESRFNKYFYFEDYTGPQLTEIFFSLCEKNGYTPDEESRAYVPGFFDRLYDNRDANFGNARDVRNLFERVVSIQSDRVCQLSAPTKEDLMTLTLADIHAAETENGRKPVP